MQNIAPGAWSSNQHRTQLPSSKLQQMQLTLHHIGALHSPGCVVPDQSLSAIAPIVHAQQAAMADVSHWRNVPHAIATQLMWCMSGHFP